ncbi:MAG TPA: XRE family transcriptional regulator [Pseudonocardiaceae bacterium]|nr:XRE family transcriptional regulator [Pseudonocardiaceae bacterium]
MFEGIADFNIELLISALFGQKDPRRRRVTTRYRAEPLTSTTRRSAEEWMLEDWAAVAKAINERVNELGWLQRELAKRAHVSQAIVREIQHHVVERHRSPRTLESLSIALGWHPQHLDAVLRGRRPAEPNEPVTDDGDTLWSRLDALEQRMSEITERLDDLKADLATVIKHVRASR